MKPALQHRLQQQLTLTPQLQQAIRLLQLSSVELETELRAAAEANPMLDLSEAEWDGEESYESGDQGEQDAHDEQNSDAEAEPLSAQDSADEQHSAEDFELPSDFDDDGDRPRSTAHDRSEMESQDAVPEDLRDHLRWQLNLTPLSQRDRTIGGAIVEAVNDDGYLHEDVESLRRSLGDLHNLSDEEIEAMRHRIQHFDPLGVASRSLSECLRAQLDAFDPKTPGWRCACEITCAHLELLARDERTRLGKLLQADMEEIAAAIALVRSLDPKPGAQYSAATPEFVVPDAYARRQNGRWAVVLSSHCQPRLSINRQYSALVNRARADDAHYLRGQLQEARWLIKSLATRADTMLKVATAIVRAQSAFLDFGAEAMRPLVLRDIAEQIQMHESTVSRMTTRKYLHTPRGTFEFKYFFSSGVGTVDGGAASATAIQAMIKKLIDEEPSKKPLSDQVIAAELNRRGIEVARRTVAKYREGMNIASSSERGRLR